ncbi:Hypothetical predicted protein [Paramuricea clavata]|uniref:Uncharacterized protein n=1 Tax=Paramuricea clavata TaxID=317549 RepID=A0A7D9E1K8_PARCT|nr:Hypothetical predicted protein [Paramuricea clavata]
MEELIPLFFALDHVNYTRWASIHICDLKSLPDNIAKEFQNEGHWVLSKTGNRFPTIPFDKAHEQENNIVKSAGGAVGLTENPVAFRRWMLSGPETTRLLHQFEEQYLGPDSEEFQDRLNHEMGLSAQKTFKKQVNNLVDVIRTMENPFLDDFPELVTLDSRDCMDDAVAEAVVNLEQLGKKQYQDFVKAVIKDRTISITNPIKKNKLPLYGKRLSRAKSKQSKTITALQNNDSRQVDVVWDSYVPDSLKESSREKRGLKGMQRKVAGSTKLPPKWIQFLCDSANKQELFAFLTSKVAAYTWPETKTVYRTSDSNRSMPECNHEEADTRIVVHVLHAIQVEQAKSVLVRTVDTDVVVILVGTFYNLKSIVPDLDLLGEARSRSLPVFHALTGCDTTSSFYGKGKKSAWQAWELYPDVTSTFEFLAKNVYHQLTADSAHFKRIERYVVVLFDKSSPLDSINRTRMELFCKNNRAMDKLPPIQDALLQHVHRSIFQVGIWSTSEHSQQAVPSPDRFSWKKEGGSWVPKWITIPEVSKACSELTKCTCKGSCTRCKCTKAYLVCTPLCRCKCVNSASDP